MLYLDYAKPLADGKYILSFFADSAADLESISHGQKFVTKNGTDYGVPQPSSTVVITMPDKTKKTYVLNEAGEWQEGGVDMDYSKLENAPITLANLADEDFVPEANTYYEHLGETTGDFIKGIIYLYDGKEYKAIDGSGSGGGVQADYNQNDSTAADYIKNRPFYGATDYTLIRNNAVYEQNPDLNNIYTTPLFDSEEDMVQLSLKDTINVNWGGKIYTCQRTIIEELALFGNAHLFDNSQIDNGDPFVIIAISDGTTYMILYFLGVKTQQDEQNTFSIVVKDANYVKKINTKFLPTAKEMITAEERAGTFSVPEPTNPTDLTDKNYVDNSIVANDTSQGTNGGKLRTLRVNEKNYTIQYSQVYLHQVTQESNNYQLYFSLYTTNNQRSRDFHDFLEEGVSIFCQGYIWFKSPTSTGLEARVYPIKSINRGSDNLSERYAVTVFKDNGIQDYILDDGSYSDNVYSFPNYYYID